MLFYEKPVVAFFARPAMHSYQVPAAAELFALKGECEMALCQAFVWIAFRLPMATVPDHDRAATIFTLRDRAFEFVIGYRMILNLHCQPLFAWHQARAARHRPAFHHAVEFETKIVMQSSRRVLLDDEGIATFSRHLALRLGGNAKAPLAAIRLETRLLSRAHDGDSPIFSVSALAGPFHFHRAVSYAASETRLSSNGVLPKVRTGTFAQA